MADHPARVVVVTGAASGIGRAVALRLAAPGTGLVRATRANAAGLDEVAVAAMARGATVTTFVGDLTTAGAPAALAARSRSAHGRIDQLVSNAGTADKRPFGAFAGSDLDALHARKESAHGALDEAGWSAAAAATPLGRIAEPDDVAAAIALLTAHDARHITGQILRVDGGLSLR